MWFADKLGPVPKGTPQGRAHPQTAQPAAAQAGRNAAPAAQAQQKGQSQQKAQPQAKARPAPEPEPPKKKKGWF